MLFENIPELTDEEIKRLQVDLSMVNVCKRLRRLARLDRVRLDESEHRSGLNRHLFSYIEYCGLDVLQFIKQYLSNLQPYMIERIKGQEKKDSFICVLDYVYRVSVYIKVDDTQFEEIVISFHESNNNGRAKSNAVNKLRGNRNIPVFVDTLSAVDYEHGICSFNVFIQRGLLILPVSTAGRKYKDVFIVIDTMIDNIILNYCNQYITDLYTSDLGLNITEIELFSALQQLSFTSYGDNPASSISMLIDSFLIQNDLPSKRVADFAITTFVGSLKLSQEQANELSSVLRERWTVSSIKGIDNMLDKIDDILCADHTLLGSNNITALVDSTKLME